jgi:hypothetical protein
MTSAWQPYREPMRTTLARTIAIALIVGAVIVRVSGGGIARWPMAVALVLWPSFGGHWVDLWFLNWLRPRISPARAVQVAARLTVWFAGGLVLALGMRLTAMALGYQRPPWTAWWLAGLAFIGVELVAHLALQLRGRPSFYNSRG